MEMSPNTQRRIREEALRKASDLNEPPFAVVEEMVASAASDKAEKTSVGGKSPATSIKSNKGLSSSFSFNSFGLRKAAE